MNKHPYGKFIKIKESTYLGIKNDATFIDLEYGEWTTSPECIMYYNSCHPKRSEINRQNTNIKKYGVPFLAQNKDIFDKQQKKSKTATQHIHWKTNEQITAVGSYECTVIKYLNLHKIDFLWQPKTFQTEIKSKSGKYSFYTPDLFLVENNMWIEIKGYKREKNIKKWNWFHSEYPNSELWDRDKLKQLSIL